MNPYPSYPELNHQIEISEVAIYIFLGILILIFARNWYNSYRKRSFRKKNKQLNEQLEASQLGVANFDKELRKIKKLEDKLANKHNEIFQLQQE